MPEEPSTVRLPLDSPLLVGSVEPEHDPENFEPAYYIIFRSDVQLWCSEVLDHEVGCEADFDSNNGEVILHFGSVSDASAFQMKWI